MSMWLTYVYAVKLPSGRLVRAGQDFGPTADTYKVGDSLGIKNGKEGVVLAVVKGDDAKLNGADVLIIVEERPARTGVQSTGKMILQMSQELQSPRLTSRPQMQALFGGQKVRAVRNSIYFRSKDESFYDFQINLLLWALGKPWYETEMEPIEERHIILRWRHERSELLKAHQKPGDDPNKPVAAPMTGNVKALQVLADDIYQLEHALKTPRKIIDRLRDPRQFQGVRNEIAVASVFARCGFDIHFIDDDTKRNPEFIAERGAEKIAVEAKSRHRVGVLEERGVMKDDPAPAKIKEHYENALQQNPGGIPFMVFIDVNLALTPALPPMEKPWVKEAMKCFDDRRQEGKATDPDTGLILTNFGWHYYRDRAAMPGECITVRTANPQFPIQEETWKLLDRALSEYGFIVDEEQYEKEVRARYSELLGGATVS
jgi:hypothetical protein